jgi:hypothetical protein
MGWQPIEKVAPDLRTETERSIDIATEAALRSIQCLVTLPPIKVSEIREALKGILA